MKRPEHLLDRLLLLLPGYRGYREREERRRSDNLVRDRIADTLNSCEYALHARLVQELQADAATTEAIETCRKRSNTLAARFRYAPEGAAAFMARDDIGEAELQELLKRDLELLETVQTLSEKIEDLAVQDIATVLNRIEAALGDRNAYLREFK